MNGATVDWSRLKALFNEALDLPREQRDDWIAGQCGDEVALLGELQALLAEHEAAPHALLADGATPFVDALQLDRATEVPSDAAGVAIGPYRTLRLLGEGGMGRVFLAERADGQFRQTVALKLIRSEYATKELRDRFLRERDLLARLAHTNIAQLHDGGMDSTGAPYFTLEYVAGEPITRWCDARHLDLHARAGLLLKVCDAVQHAHRNLIVHRDIKPSNILVAADGEPKLLDFGIAKPLEAEAPGLTATHSRPMTREYAAPEQILGEPITTATDVYALGVLFYELLTGHSPYARAERGETSWPKAILEEGPEPLSRALERTTGSAKSTVPDAATQRGTTAAMLQRLLSGDLNHIARRALEKAPEARYPSVTALAADLQAWLDGRALPGASRRDRLVKFIRRNRGAVGVAALLLFVMIASLAAIAIEARQAAREAQTALKQTRTTAAVKDFLLDLFHKADPNVAKGKEITARELVDRGVQRVESIPAEQAPLKAELQSALGTIYFQLGLNKQAAELHEKAFDALKATDADAVLAAVAERDLATELVPLGSMAKAHEHADDSLARLHALPNAPRTELILSLYTVGWVAESEHDAGAALKAAGEAIALARKPPVDELELALALSLEGSAHWAAHDNEAAARSFGEAMELHARLLGPDDQLTLRDNNGVATALFMGGHYDEAAGYFRKSHAGFARLYGSNDVRSLHALEGLALVEHEAGHYRDSLRDLEQILAALKENPPQNNKFQTEVEMNHGLLLADLGELAAAEREVAAAREIFVALLGEKSANSVEALADLGYIHGLQGKLESAEVELRHAVAAKEQAHDDDISSELAHLSDVRRQRGEAADAVALGEQARANALKLFGERSRQSAVAHACLAQALLAAQRSADAEAEARAAVKSFVLIAPPDGLHPFSAGARMELGTLLAAHERDSSEARALLRDAVKLREDTYGADHPFTREARAALARVEESH